VCDVTPEQNHAVSQAKAFHEAIRKVIATQDPLKRILDAQNALRDRSILNCEILCDELVKANQSIDDIWLPEGPPLSDWLRSVSDFLIGMRPKDLRQASAGFVSLDVGKRCKRLKESFTQMKSGTALSASSLTDSSCELLEIALLLDSARRSRWTETISCIDDLSKELKRFDRLTEEWREGWARERRLWEQNPNKGVIAPPEGFVRCNCVEDRARPNSACWKGVVGFVPFAKQGHPPGNSDESELKKVLLELDRADCDSKGAAKAWREAFGPAPLPNSISDWVDTKWQEIWGTRPCPPGLDSLKKDVDEALQAP
jgi:hypothetical protein